ncbi:hypothetical protein GGS20DRAFT_121626 [Poronia punctata]|nr:hypothetical protein GGS20DRAFT_121626 [Poronia punctata]
MHYIRLLRPAKVQNSRSGPVLEVLFTVTTDLGDSLLCPEDGPLELTVCVTDLETPACTCRCAWKPGMRVLDAKVRLRPGLLKNYSVSIFPTKQQRLSGLRVADVLPSGDDTLRGEGVVMPVTFDVVDGVCAPVSLRTLTLEKGGDGEGGFFLQFEEDIGESIARHIWDAGVVTSAYLADAGEKVRAILPIRTDRFNVLELGSGVGILGITIAGILRRNQVEDATVLLTDLAEAEERARSNISRAEDHAVVRGLEYENLDWDDGRQGRFGPLVATTPWDLVVLSDCTYNVDSFPALVGTLSALHVVKQRQCNGEDRAKSRVLLATKPRHSSEKALFDLLDEEDWRHRVIKEIPLPLIGGEDEVVQIYILEKGALGD